MSIETIIPIDIWNLISGLLNFKSQLQLISYCTFLMSHLKITDLTNLSFMKNLKILNAGGYCEIDQNGIDGLDLIELDVGYNLRIANVSFMKNLKKLSANGYDCG